MISLGRRLGYGVGGAVFAVKEAAYAVFVLLFYTQVLGLSGALAGAALFAAILFDCASDPVIGAWSDRLRSAWGRRHPFMLAGCLPLGLGFLGLFAPPPAVAESSALLTLWLLFFSVWIRTFLSMYTIPHLAMTADMSSDYRERSMILGTRLFFMFVSAVLLPALALLLIFGETLNGGDGRFIQANYPVYGIASCLFTWAVGLGCIWATRPWSRSNEPQDNQPQSNQFRSGPLQDGQLQGAPNWNIQPGNNPPETAAAVRFGMGGLPSRPPLLDVLKSLLLDFARTLRNANFRALLSFEIAAQISYGIMTALNTLAFIYFWELGAIQLAAVFAVPSLLGVGLALPAMKWLGARLQKQDIMRLACALMIFDALWLYAFRYLGWLPDNHHPAVFWCIFAQMGAWMFLYLLRGIAAQSLTVDIADELALQTGARQEGSLFAVTAFAQKLASAIGPLYAGIALDVIGLHRGMPPGAVPDPALHGLALALVIGITPLLPALHFSRRITLNETTLRQIQRQIQQRVPGRKQPGDGPRRA